MYRCVVEKNGQILKDRDEYLDAAALEATVYFEEFCKEHNTEGDCVLYKDGKEVMRSDQITTRGQAT